MLIIRINNRLCMLINGWIKIIINRRNKIIYRLVKLIRNKIIKI